jgi:hypothetical protein
MTQPTTCKLSLASVRVYTTVQSRPRLLSGWSMEPGFFSSVHWVQLRSLAPILTSVLRDSAHWPLNNPATGKIVRSFISATTFIFFRHCYHVRTWYYLVRTWYYLVRTWYYLVRTWYYLVRTWYYTSYVRDTIPRTYVIYRGSRGITFFYSV